MTTEITGVRGVTKNYGARDTGGAVGQYKSIGPVKTLSFKLSKESLESYENGVTTLNSYVASGITVTSARLIVKEAFDATAEVTITASNAQGTIPVAATELGSTGVTDITTTGHLSVGGLTDDVGVLTVTSAVAGAVEGEAEIILEYIQTELK